MNALVGYTGFVGSNIYEEGHFDYVFNSKNIKDAYGLKPDLLIYAGVRAEKYLANNFPEKDYEQILQAEDNIKKIAPKKLVLISTVDVFSNPVNVDEDSIVDVENLHPYGLNRYKLELWVRKNYPDTLIIRLPGLFGKNIKKNFIYDYIKRIPFMLKKNKFDELVLKDFRLKDYYFLKENDFYQCRELNDAEENVLKEIFSDLGFSALNFTDSRNVYQFYPLKRLWSDIQVCLDNDMKLWHAAVEPISIGELYKSLSDESFVNEFLGEPVVYDFKTKCANLFNGKREYIMNKDMLIKLIRAFILKQKVRL